MSLKKKIALGLGGVVLLFALYVIYIFFTTKSHSPAAVAVYQENGMDIQIDYCQPYKKERLIFGTADEGALLPYSKYWRLGANEATKLTLGKDLNFGGKVLAAGSYSIYAFPEKDHWVIGINSESDRWGASAPDFSKDLGRIKVPSTVEPESLEQFTITVESVGSDAVMVMQWDHTKIEVPLKSNT